MCCIVLLWEFEDGALFRGSSSGETAAGLQHRGKTTLEV